MRSPRSENGKRLEVVCPCGNVRLVPPSRFDRAKYCSKECRAKYRVQPPRTHGLTSHELYSTWRGMLWRCDNETPGRGHPDYSGRGITVCEEWKDIHSFIGWIDSHIGPRPDGFTLDRIDVNGNYEPGNIRWADSRLQNKNKRRSKNFTSDFPGVSRNNKTGEWRAMVYLGPFATEEEAVNSLLSFSTVERG